MSPVTQAPPDTLLTAEQYAELPDDGLHTELVKGMVIEMPSATPSHGFICGNIYWSLRGFVEPRDLGRVVTNDSGVVTARNPDSVRGPDVSFYSYTQVPKGPLPKGYWPAPELVFEVISPSNRKGAMTAKIAEYFAVGVKVVCVLDPETEILAVYPQEELPRRYTADEELTLPEVFPDFRVKVRSLVE